MSTVFCKLKKQRFGQNAAGVSTDQHLKENLKRIYQYA
jgi:hypothetical protein